MIFLKNKIVKKVFISLLVMAGIYFLLLTALSIYVNTNKNRIIATIKETLKENVQGNITITNADVSIWSSFPKIEVELNNVSITDSVYHQPFLQMQQVAVCVGLFDMLKKGTNISSVKLTNGLVHIFTDTSGYNNLYVVAKKKNDSTSKSKSLSIENILLQNVILLDENRKSDKRFELYFYKMDADIDKNGSVYFISMKENCLVKGLGFDLSKGSYLKDQMIEAKWKIQYNAATAILSFDETKVNISNHLFNIQGLFHLKDSAYFNLHITAKQLVYAQAEQLLPQNILHTLNLFQLTKPLDAVASVAGPLAPGTNPLINVQWKTTNNELTTPYFSLGNCSFDGSFTNEKIKGLPLTDENSEVLINSLTGTWNNIVLAGKNITVTNLTVPVMQFELGSQCTFAQLDETFALSTIRFVDGKAQLYMLYNGPFVTDASLLKKLNVKLQLRNGTVEYVPRGLMFTGCNGDILFSENTLLADNLVCDLKQNHFEVNISGDDLSKLSNNNPGKANLVCSVFTPSLNLSDFNNLFSEKQKTVSRKKSMQQLAATALNIDDLLENGNLQVNIKAGKIFMNKFEATDIAAQLFFQQNDWQIQNAVLHHAGGTLNMSGKIHEVSADYHEANANIQLQNVDVKKLFYTFNDFGQTGISSENLRGIINTKANITLGLDDKGSIIKNSLQGTVDFTIKKGALINYEPIQRIKQYVFKNRDFNNIEFAELTDGLKIKNGDIYINRMEIQSSAVTLFVEGVYSLKNNTDISIQVPLSNLAKRDENYKPVNGGADAKAGPSIYLRARPDKDGNIKVGLDVFKKFRKSTSEQMAKDSL